MGASGRFKLIAGPAAIQFIK